MATTKKTAARPVAKKATAKTQRTYGTVEKSATNKDPMDKDFTYLQEKDPSELHVLLAKTIEQRSDIEITAKQVQAVLAFHPHFQRSKLNRSRAGYVGLDEAIVSQRSVHMVAAHQDAAAIIAERQKAKPARKRTAKKTTTAA